MYRHILLAVDGSAASRHVAEHAFELAAQLGTPVTLLHVLEDVAVPFAQYGMEPYVDFEALSPGLVEAQRQGATRMLAGIAALAPAGLDVDTAVIEATGHRVGEVITREAEQRGADLVVLGTHGQRGLSRVFLGSVADSVLRTASIPVTLVRHHEHDADDPSAGSDPDDR